MKVEPAITGARVICSYPISQQLDALVKVVSDGFHDEAKVNHGKAIRWI